MAIARDTALVNDKKSELEAFTASLFPSSADVTFDGLPGVTTPLPIAGNTSAWFEASFDLDAFLNQFHSNNNNTDSAPVDDDDLISNCGSRISESTQREVKGKLEKGSAAYKAKRNRNNEAVRKCREKKRQQLTNVDSRCKTLESENLTLRSMIESLKAEVTSLRSQITH